LRETERIFQMDSVYGAWPIKEKKKKPALPADATMSALSADA